MAIIGLLVTSSGLINIAGAASLTHAYDLLSSSDRSVVATHTVSFVIQAPLIATDYVNIDLPAGFATITAAANITCPAGFTNPATVANAGATARCVASGPISAGATTTITISGITNHATAGSYTIPVSTYSATGPTLKERANVMVAIIDHVTINATVPSTLNFTISPLATSTGINGATTTAASATTTIDFGSLQVGTSSIMGQELRVTTNANYGYKVTVEQNQDLTNNTNATINAFADAVTSVVSAPWAAPTGILDSFNTYGHMGVTSSDGSLSVNPFGSNQWKGFNGTSPMEVLYHTGPADGTTTAKGLAYVGYRIQISPLQEAGDYTNTLTYIATPIY